MIGIISTVITFLIVYSMSCVVFLLSVYIWMHITIFCVISVSS